MAVYHLSSILRVVTVIRCPPLPLFINNTLLIINSSLIEFFLARWPRMATLFILFNFFLFLSAVIIISPAVSLLLLNF